MFNHRGNVNCASEGQGSSNSFLNIYIDYNIFLVDLSEEHSSTVFYMQFALQRKLLHSIKANAWSGAALNSTYWFCGNLKLLCHLFLPLYLQLSIFSLYHIRITVIEITAKNVGGFGFLKHIFFS
jgi:hypothetical protein